MSCEHESAALEREIAVFNYFITAASTGSVLLRNRRDTDMTRFEHMVVEGPTTTISSDTHEFGRSDRTELLRQEQPTQLGAEI